MLNRLISFLFNKQIIIYENHRNVAPLLNNFNKHKFIFISANPIWKILTVLGNRKLRDKAVLLVLKVVNPVAILSMNWISNRQHVYFLFAKQKKREFIVVQHGSYVGGIIKDEAHKFAKCTTMLCWSKFFTDTFTLLNPNTITKFINYGNPVYNMYNRATFTYNEAPIKNILCLPTYMKEEYVLKRFKKLYDKLLSLGYNVVVGEHSFQKRLNPLSNVNVSNTRSLELLKKNEFDLVISDHSSALLDAIFFKNKVLYFNAHLENTENKYSEYLLNINTLKIEEITQDILLNTINIKDQELLFSELSGGYTKNNIITFL